MRDFFLGKHAFDFETPWGGWGAFFASLGFFIFQILIALVIGGVVAFSLFETSEFAGGIENLDVKKLGDVFNITFLACEIFAFLVVIYVAGRRGGKRENVLLMRTPYSIGTNLVFGIFALMVFFVFLSATVNLFFEQAGMQSNQQMTEIFTKLGKSDYLWAGLLAIVVGAPLFEEAVFRGFLLTAISKTKLGFAGGAVISSAIWAVLHAGYAPVMIVGLFVFGLLLSLVVRRSGSLWIAVLMHALWNGFVAYGVFTMLGGT
jgi:membrane protease YdiL (CAAX protease family)